MTAALLALVLLGATPVLPDDPPAGELDALRMWEGRILCLADGLTPSTDPPRCNDLEAAPGFALEDKSGQQFLFLPDDPQADMFVDPVVRGRTIRVVGWPRPGDQIEILHVYSVHDGHLHDLYYRCDVCNITATAPGPCWCCQQPFELRETPAESPPPLALEGLQPLKGSPSPP